MLNKTMIRLSTRNVAVAVLLAGALAGCGGGGGGRRSSASTVAPTTSGNAPTTSGTTVQPPVTTPPAPVVTPTTANGNVILASVLQNQVQVIDLATNKAKATIPVGKGPMAVATQGSYAYVANSIDQTVSVIDLLTNSVTATMDTTAPGVTNLPLIGNTVDPILAKLVRPTGIAVTPNGQKAFTANLVNVTSYDLVAKKPLKSIFGLNLNLSGSGLTGIINLITSNLSAFLQQPLTSLGQARVATTNKTAFVTNTITHNVTVISASDDRVITNTNVGKLPIGVSCAANKAYVACVLSNEIWVLDETTGAVLKTISSNGAPVDVASSPTGDKVYVANFLGGDITVIDTASDLPVNSLPAGLNIGSIFQQLGVPIPASSGGGIGGAISSFLSGFLGGSGASTGGSLGGLLGGSGPSTVNSIMNGLMSAFLSFAGINQSTLNSLNMPGLGIIGVSVTADGKTVVGANLAFGLTVTDIAGSTSTAPQLFAGNGLGASAVAAGR